MANVVQSAGNSGTGATVVATLGSAPTPGNQLIAIVSSFQLSATLTCASTGATWVKVIAVDGDGTHNDWAVFITTNPGSGTAVTIGSTGSLATAVQVLEVSGSANAGTLAASNTATDMNDNTSPYLTGSVTAGPNDLTVAAFNVNRSGTIGKPGAPWNTITDQAGAVNPSQYLVWRNDAGSFTASFTDTVNDAGEALILVLAGATSVAPAPPARPLLVRLAQFFPFRTPLFGFPAPAAAGTATTPVSATVDVIIEALQGVSLTVDDPLESASGVASSATDPLDATQGVTGAAVDSVEAAAGVTAALTGPVEALQGVAAAGATDPVESTQGVSSTQTGQLDAAQQLAAALAAPVELRGGVSASAVDQLDAAQGVAATTGSTVVEALNGLASTVAGVVEATGGIASTTASILEALQGVAASGSDPLDAQGNTPVTATTAAVIEALQAITAPAIGALDTVQALASTRLTAVESLASALATAGVPVEAAQAIATAASVLPVETVAAVAITAQLPVEALQLVRQAVTGQLDAVAATPSGAEVPGSVSLSAAPFATVVLLARAFAQLAVSAQAGTVPGFGVAGFGVDGFGGSAQLGTVTLSAAPAAEVVLTAEPGIVAGFGVGGFGVDGFGGTPVTVTVTLSAGTG